MNNLERISFKSIKFDQGAQGLLILLCLSQLFLSNGIYLFFGSLCLGAALYYLQQPFKPSVFTLIFLYHFIQISAGIWQANYADEDINFRSNHSDMAIIFSYAGLVCMFLPIIYYQRKIPNLSLDLLRNHANKMSIDKTFKAYLIAFFVANALGAVAFAFPGFTQIIFSFVNIKWFFFLLFSFQVLLKKRFYKQLAIMAGVEFIMGFASYFSDFKTVIFFSAFVAISFIVSVKLKHLIFAIAGIVLMSFLAIKWTAIKGEYRLFLNQGSKSQNVNVSTSEALSKILELATEERDRSKDDPIYHTLDRIQYTYHLAKTMDRMPGELTHEYGKNIGKILEFVLTPRFLNPDKPTLKATEKTIKYTGISYAGYNQGVSFSLGYFADAYIDFGYYGMMFPLIILGFIFGASYFYFVRRSSVNYVFNFAVVGAMYMEFTAYEADGTYVMGRLFATLLTFLLLKFFFFPWLYNQIKLK